MKKIHYIILLLLMPLALGAQSISPTCRTCGKKIALCPYKGKHPTKQSQSRQHRSNKPSSRPSTPHSNYGSTHQRPSSQQPQVESRLYVTNKRFEDGTDRAGYYTGYVKDGMRQGEGTTKFDNGTVAVGNWEHDRMNGKGTATASNGQKYEGEFKDSNFDGFGTLTYEKGGKYIGTWKDDKKDGYGIEVFPDGSELRSTFKDGYADGYYMYVQKGGGYRIGKFEGDKLEGHSLYFGNDGKPMYALFKDDKCVETTDLTATSRPGTYSYKHTYDDGTYVEGNITNGKGLCKYPNGDVYEGEWKDSNPHGFGIYRFKNGDIYIGEWNEGKKDGIGIYFYKSSNDAYAGNWREGKKCYNGTYLWYESGNAYVGQWSNDSMSDLGTMYHRNSKCTRGRWANDKLVEKL